MGAVGDRKEHYARVQHVRLRQRERRTLHPKGLHRQKAKTPLTKLDQAEYVAARLTELHQCRRRIRANLASARLLWRQNPLDLEIRQLVIEALANLEIANAKIEVLETPWLPRKSELRWMVQLAGRG